jgi:hypothetical protein
MAADVGDLLVVEDVAAVAVGTDAIEVVGVQHAVGDALARRLVRCSAGSVALVKPSP